MVVLMQISLTAFVHTAVILQNLTSRFFAKIFSAYLVLFYDSPSLVQISQTSVCLTVKIETLIAFWYQDGNQKLVPRFKLGID